MTTILLVEDNALNRDMLSRRLIRRGYAVITANDGEQGHAMACSLDPDLILMDIGLPGMDGWQVTQLLKSNARTREIPIIALTAHALLTDRDKAREVGCDEYDTKPIELSRLLQKIEMLLVARKVSL
jgi:two-component system cell cycle response regulator DivK